MTSFLRRVFTAAVWLLACIASAGLAAEPERLAPGFTVLPAGQKVVLMPIDVELFSLGAGGVSEPKADWTARARALMDEALRARLAEQRLQLVALEEKDADDFAELVGLHAAVARSIGWHHSDGDAWALPSKQGRLDWSFGDAMRPLQQRLGARYAIFVWVRDRYATAGRYAAMVAWAALGVGIPAGLQVGYASLVDLETGQLLWFNRLQRLTGDLREAKPAAESVNQLFTGFPAAQ